MNNEERLNNMVYAWVFSATDYQEFYERYDRREEFKNLLIGQILPIEHYPTAWSFFYE